jgi:tetratricopeptide (TPR) repeat protein
VLAAYRATHTPPHPLLASAASLEASCALDIGDLPRASRAASAALAMYEQLPERQSHQFAGALVNLGRVRTEMGDLGEGIALCRRALQMLGKIERPSLQTSARAHAWLGRALALSNQWQEGYAEAERAVDIASKATLAPPSLLPHMQVTKAMVCLMCGDAEAAAPAAAAALQGFAAIRPDGAGVGGARFALGWAANMRGEPKPAEPLLRDALAILLRCYGASHPFTATVRCELGVSLARQGQLTDAAPMFEQAYAVQLAAGKDDNPFLVIPAINLAYLRSAEGQKQAAARLAMQVLQIQSRHRLQNDLRTPMAIDLLLQTLDAVEDGAERRGLQQQLVQCTEALLPAADKLRRKVAEAAMHW